MFSNLCKNHTITWSHDILHTVCNQQRTSVDVTPHLATRWRDNLKAHRCRLPLSHPVSNTVLTQSFSEQKHYQQPMSLTWCGKRRISPVCTPWERTLNKTKGEGRMNLSTNEPSVSHLYSAHRWEDLSVWICLWSKMGRHKGGIMPVYLNYTTEVWRLIAVKVLRRNCM